MKKSAVVLDTSAVVCLFENEAGADLVEEHLESARDGRSLVLLSFVTLTELYYTTARAAGASRAAELVAVLKSWPAQIIFADEALCLLAAELKAGHQLSLADAFVGATARPAGRRCYTRIRNSTPWPACFRSKRCPIKSDLAAAEFGPAAS